MYSGQPFHVTFTSVLLASRAGTPLTKHGHFAGTILGPDKTIVIHSNLCHSMRRKARVKGGFPPITMDVSTTPCGMNSPRGQRRSRTYNKGIAAPWRASFVLSRINTPITCIHSHTGRITHTRQYTAVTTRANVAHSAAIHESRKTSSAATAVAVPRRHTGVRESRRTRTGTVA